MAMGRPTSLTPELQAAIVACIEAGNYRVTACASVGIHRHTLQNWEKWGLEGKAPYVDLLAALLKAEAKSEVDLLASVRNAESGDLWQNKAWMLERRFATRWCAKVKQQVAEHVDALTEKLKADPELHRRVVDVLADSEPSAGAGSQH